MYIPVWILILVVAPWALALFVGLVLLLGVSTLYALCQLWDGIAACTAWGLGWLVYPFRHLGPWFDYAAVAGVMVGLVSLTVLLG